MRVSLVCVLLSAGCFTEAPSEVKPPPVPEVLTCATDADCVLFDVGTVCCGTLCGDEGGVSTRAYADAYRAWEEKHCENHASEDCPVARCPKPRPWDSKYAAACVENACQATESFYSLPDKASLVHLCTHMAAGPTKAVDAAPPEEKQTVWMSEMSAAATAANIPGWSAFADQLQNAPTTHKQKWLSAGVVDYGLQTECAVILAVGDVK